MCMEIIEKINEAKEDYVVPSTTSFSRIEEVLSFMPNFAEKSRLTESIQDIYYETPNKLLQELGASVKIRSCGTKKYIHVVCYYFKNKREYVKEISIEGEPFESEENLIFIEDKLQNLYTHTLEVDVIRLLTHLKPMFKCNISRTTINYVNSSSLLIKTIFDNVNYYSKRNTHNEKYLSLILEGFAGQEQKFVFNRFSRELNSKVIIIPEKIDMYKKGKLVMVFTKEKIKKQDLEEEEEEEAPQEEQVVKRSRSNF